MPSPDELLKMIVENIQNDGICCHIRKLFESGKGPLAYGLYTLIAHHMCECRSILFPAIAIAAGGILLQPSEPAVEK